jgi:hypothetical protein
MPIFKKKPDKNILEMVPYHVVKNYTEENGLITLNLPKFKSPVFTKWLVPNGKSPYIHIKFDKNGSQVWKHINGADSIQKICDRIRENFPGDEGLNQLEERAAKFITELYKSRFIRFADENQFRKQ